MATQQKGSGRANALKGELVVRLEEASTAPIEAVYDGSEVIWPSA